LANQEVLLWIKSVVEECGEDISKEQLKEYVWKTLNSGKVKTGNSSALTFFTFWSCT
jgi:citrate synthase